MSLKQLLVILTLVSLFFWSVRRASEVHVPARMHVARAASESELRARARAAASGEQAAASLDSALGSPRTLREILPRRSQEPGSAYQVEIEGLLEGGALGYRELSSLWDRTPDDRESIVRAVGRVADVRGLRFLRRVLDEGSALEGSLLSEIARLAPLADSALASELGEALRWRLRSSDDAAIVQAAMIALGRLGDEESIPILIGLLEDESRGVRARAAHTLARITGVSQRKDAHGWAAWYERENEWVDENFDRLCEQLDSEDEGEIFAAVRALARVKLHRDEAAEYLLILLDHDQPSIRRIVCQALGQLGSRVAVMPLVSSLVDEDVGVARSAWIALRWLTGLELPLDASAWEEAAASATASRSD